ncbi:MAG: S46 family peptidase, partial [Melioribacteraceae bacterium]|nr:S46 family peptidase [Melioribacteraceae bacterium]
MKKAKLLFLFIILTISLGMISSAPEEGMYPLSEIENIDLVEAGLKIDPKEIYNPEGVSLIDALVKINGCTGSFVSGDGLVITNHHCAFGAIRQASTPEENYLENGFLAETREKEIPASGYVVRITESYEDVSEQILNAASGAADLAERAKLIENKIKEIEAEASDETNSIEARVSEMFIGKTYILFKYRLIRDVRLVYAPPRSIGEFGGELDNWIWPRHTGDFTFMRAYVAPDGSAADYSEENVPYSPKRFLKVNPNGVREGDFVFILGYPGRTYRHRTSNFLEYQQYYQLPFISDLYEWMINKLEDISSEDPAIALKYASRIKGLANTKKNYQGKLKGLRRIELIDKKKEEEKMLQLFIDSDSDLKNRYGTLLQEINEAYKPRFEHGYSNLWLGGVLRFSTPIRIASSVLSFKENISELPEENYDSLFTEQALRFEGRMKNAFSSLDHAFDKPLLARVNKQAVLNSEQFKIDALKQ